jgi:hypothetical protein
MAKKYYEIGGVKFWQDILILWQKEELGTLLVPLLTDGKIGVQAMIEAALAQHKLAAALAIVLVREGVALEDKDLAADEKLLRFNLNTVQTGEILRDFFTINGSAIDNLLKSWKSNELPIELQEATGKMREAIRPLIETPQ